MFVSVTWSVSSMLLEKNSETIAPFAPPWKYKKSFLTMEIAHGRKSLYVWYVGLRCVKDAR